jgi:single-stranded DNA-binding protein
MKKTHDLLATVGEYEDRQSGEKKKRRVNVGCIMQDDEGRLSVKLETVPVSPNWSGWLNAFPADQKRAGEAPTRESRPSGASRPAAPQPEDDDIPF